MTKQKQHLYGLKLEKEKNVPRSRMQPPSKTPCQHKALAGKAAHPRKSIDYDEAGVPQHITEIGEWNLGLRLGYDNQPLPANKEAELLSSACGGHIHDCSRCTQHIMGNGDDNRNLARQPLQNMKYQRRQVKYELRDSAKKDAFHVNTAKSESAADSDDETEEGIHVAFGYLTAPTDHSPRTPAPAPKSLGHRLVTFLDAQLMIGEPNETQMGIFTDVQRQAVSYMAASRLNM
jgi:hypothetical protein